MAVKNAGNFVATIFKKRKDKSMDQAGESVSSPSESTSSPDQSKSSNESDAANIKRPKSSVLTALSSSEKPRKKLSFRDPEVLGHQGAIKGTSEIINTPLELVKTQGCSTSIEDLELEVVRPGESTLGITNTPLQLVETQVCFTSIEDLELELV